jgi:hypothetical protein
LVIGTTTPPVNVELRPAARHEVVLKQTMLSSSPAPGTVVTGPGVPLLIGTRKPLLPLPLVPTP